MLHAMAVRKQRGREGKREREGGGGESAKERGEKERVVERTLARFLAVLLVPAEQHSVFLPRV